MPKNKKTTWQINWARKCPPGRTAYWGRNPISYLRCCRKWHWVDGGFLRHIGINTPIFRKDSWEVNWKKRKRKLVWARNELSKMPSARKWHWIDFHTLERAGLKWMPKRKKTGRYICANGYVNLTPTGMTDAEIKLADEHNLWMGERRTRCLEHRLRALIKYGKLSQTDVVRHLNGIKSDNSPNNLVIGTTQENTMDHNKARLMVMYWKCKYYQLLKRIKKSNNSLHE